jgi:hypothetical protein
MVLFWLSPVGDGDVGERCLDTNSRQRVFLANWGESFGTKQRCRRRTDRFAVRRTVDSRRAALSRGLPESKEAALVAPNLAHDAMRARSQVRRPSSWWKTGDG